MTWDITDMLSANADTFGTETVTVIPERSTTEYDCTQVQWSDEASQTQDDQSGVNTTDTAHCVILAENAPTDMPEPDTGWTLEHDGETYYVATVRRLGGEGWKLRLTRSTSESTAPDYYGRG